MSGDDTQPVIQSLETGINLFKHLQRFGRPATLTELARRADMHPSKAHRYLVSLIRVGFVESAGRGLYRTGPYLMELAAAGVDRTGVLEVAEHGLEALAGRLGETAFLTVWARLGPRVVRVVDGPGPVTIRPRIEAELPLWNSSSSRAFVAWRPEAEIQALVQGEIERDRAQGLGEAEAESRRQRLMQELECTRRQGVARTTGERYEGLVSFSAPIFDARARVVVVVTTFGLATTLSSNWDNPAVSILRSYAEDVTRQIGGCFPDLPPWRGA